MLQFDWRMKWGEVGKRVYADMIKPDIWDAEGPPRHFSAKGLSIVRLMGMMLGR